jgi:hypothetical protein
VFVGTLSINEDVCALTMHLFEDQMETIKLAARQRQEEAILCQKRRHASALRRLEWDRRLKQPAGLQRIPKLAASS